MERASSNFGTLHIKFGTESFTVSGNSVAGDAENVMESLHKVEAECEETDTVTADLGDIVDSFNGESETIIKKENGLIEVKIEVFDDEVMEEEDTKDIKPGIFEESDDENGYLENNDDEDEDRMVIVTDEDSSVNIESVQSESDKDENEADTEEADMEEEFEEDGIYTCFLCKETLIGGKVVKDHLLNHIKIRQYNCLDGCTIYTPDCLKEKHSLIEFEMVGESLQGRLYRYVNASQLVTKEDTTSLQNGSHSIPQQEHSEQTKSQLPEQQESLRKPQETSWKPQKGLTELQKRLRAPIQAFTKIESTPSLNTKLTNDTNVGYGNGAPVTFQPAAFETITNIPYLSNRPFVCLECHKGFVNGEDLKSHNILEHDKDGVYFCPHCNAAFSKEQKLRAHLKSNEEKGCEVHMCTYCNKIFKKPEHLRTHMFIHTGRGSFECPTCKKKWKNRSILNRHLNSHKPYKEHYCAVCDKYFSSANSLKIHTYIHTGEHSFPCPICNKVYSERRFLKVHMCTHTGEGKYICKICSKSFYSSSQLRLHMCKHTGERPHVCNICSEAFLVRSSLLRHMYKHDGVKPHACLSCNKKFVLKQDLNEHTKTHAIRTHMCNICQRAFTTGAYLNRHMKQHEKGVSGKYKCDNCSLHFKTLHSLNRHHRHHHCDDDLRLNINDIQNVVLDIVNQEDAENVIIVKQEPVDHV